MKTSILISVFGLTILLSTTLPGQLPSIDSLHILPKNPAAGEQTSLICYTTFSSGDCELNDHTVNIMDTNIIVNLNYTVGDYTVICNSIDTLIIGNLNANSYTLTANLSKNLETVIYDTDTINFSVESVGIDHYSNDEDHFIIYPNPIKDKVSIEINSSLGIVNKVELFSIFGQKIFTKRNINSTKTEIDTKNLINGIYFLIITNDKQKYWIEKIIKNAP
ncbi:MAG: T9SS type A sorting domain-containing protein [Salinivirgaceae bacterium]